MHSHRQRIPPIATVGGTRFREEVVSDHEKHQCHDAEVKAKRRSEIRKTDPLSVPLFAGIRHMEEELFKKVGAYMLDVYNDAQRGTLSAWSWPSRVLTRCMADEVKIDSFHPFIPTANQVQYLNPVQHREFLRCIADVGRKNTAEELSGALAVSLRVDGLVDRQQIDNKHVCVQVVTSQGDLIHRFLGFSEPLQHRIAGYVQCIHEASKAILPWNDLIKITSSIVTDGESLNSGDRNGLWKKLEGEKSTSDPNHGPLLKIWCAAHRSNLAYKDVVKSISEVKIIVSDVVSIGSYFHVSGVRTHDLKATAESNGLPEPLHWPDFKEVRFAEFSHHLFAVFLRNYRSCMSYWEKGNDDKSKGFLHKWKNKDRIQTVCVLADVTYILKGLQKSLQKDTCNLGDLRTLKERTIKELESLRDESLTGGWEETFVSKIDSGNKFYGIQLEESRQRTSPVNLYVPDGRSFTAIRTEIIESLRNFLDERLSIDDKVMDVVEALSPQNLSKLT